MRRRLYLVVAPALVALTSAVVAYLYVTLPRTDKPLAATADSWTATTANFTGMRVDPARLYTSVIDPVYVVAGLLEGDGSGRMVSKPFTAPRWLGFTVTGNLTLPVNEGYFRLIDEDKRLPVRVCTQEHYWRRVTIGFPSDWVGKQVQFVAVAGLREATNYFGFSSPREEAAGNLLASQLRTLPVLPAFVVALVVFLLPGWPLAARLARTGVIETSFVLPAAIVFACLAGYLTFWAYFFRPGFGLGFAVAVLLGGAAATAVDLVRSGPNRALLLSGEVGTPLALMTLVGLFYLALLYSVDLQVPVSEQSRLRLTDFPLAVDNELPGRFARHLYDGTDPRHLLGDYHSSDRPPLQAGLSLLQLPLGILARQPVAFDLIAGCAFQCVWVPAAWSLWRAAGLGRRRAGLALLFVTLTGFSLLNTVFTWPKLLGGALTVFAVTLALFGGGERRQTFPQPFPLGRAALLGLSAGLAWLSHGSVAFTFLPFGLLLLVPRYFPGLSRLAVAGAVFAATAYPWSLYQTYYDPPGDALVGQHLGGASKTWERGGPVLRNLINAYQPLSAREILENKLANLQVLFRASETPGPLEYPWPPNGSPQAWPVNAVALRRCEFVALFWALGLLNLGWLVALTAWRRPDRPDPRLGVTVPALGLAGVLTWVLLMFLPGSTVIHQGSYATVLLFLAAAAAWLTTLPPRLAYVVLVLQGVLFAWGWLFTSPANGFGLPNVLMIPLALVSFVALVKVALGPSPRQEAAGGKPGARA